MREAEPLQILLLGPPDIRWQGKPLKFSRRGQRALLFYLAVEGKVSREALQELFWPSEIFGERSNVNLRVNLARLRKDLPADEILQTNKNTIWLNRDQVSIDALDFMELVDQPLRFAAQFPANVLLPEPMVSHLRHAVELWRSPSFLQGFSISETNPSLERWLERAAWRFNDTHLRALTQLSGHFSAAGDLDAAVQWTDAALDIDPWLEDLQIQKIQWLLALNRISSVLDTIQSVQDQYAHENEEIPEELAAVFHKVRRQIITFNKNSASEDWPGRLLAQVPLIGRRTELLTLQTAFRRGGIAVIWGETGSGKTRLAYELYRSLQPRPRLLVMNAIQGENRLPFQPWIDALRRSIALEEWQKLAPQWLRQIARLLPELEISSENEFSSPDAPAGLQTGMLYEALHQALLMISRSQRILIVLDSAQWCDGETMSALGYLVKRRLIAEHGLLVITAHRETAGSPLEEFLGQQSQSAYFVQMDLAALSPAETGELSLHVLDEQAEPGLTDRLVEDTGGVPLFLLETLYALLEYAPASGTTLKINQLPVGASIHSFLRERIGNLSLYARQIAEAAAMLEPEFNQSLLAALTQFDPESLARGLDELYQSGLVQPHADGSRETYKFVYGQTREVMRWELGPARTRLLHLRAARAIEDRPAPTVQSTMVLARHYEAAGETLNAIQQWVNAGIQARSLFAVEDALNAFRNAERLALRDPHSVPVVLLNDLFLHWGEIAFENNDPDLMEQIYSRMVDLGEERQSGLLLGNGLGGLATMYSVRKDRIRSMELFQKATYHLQELGDSFALANLYSRQGWYLVGRMQYAEAIALLDQAHRLVNAMDILQDEEYHAVIEYRLGMAYHLTGWSLKAQETVQGPLRHDQTPAQIYGHLVMAGAKFDLGEFAACLEHARLGIRLARSINSVILAGYLMAFQLRAGVALGQIDSVWSALPDALEFASDNQNREVFTYVQMAKGDIYRLLGDYAGAQTFYRAGLEASVRKWDSLLCQLFLGMALAGGGQLDDGLQLVSETVAEARQLDLGTVYLPGLRSQAELLAQAGRLDEAVALMDEYRDLFSKRGYGLSAYMDARVRCRAYLQKGKSEEGLRQVELAIQYARRIGSPLWELDAYRLRKLCGALDAAAAARVKELLALLEHHVRHPDLRRLAETYLQRTRAALSA